LFLISFACFHFCSSFTSVLNLVQYCLIYETNKHHVIEQYHSPQYHSAQLATMHYMFYLLSICILTYVIINQQLQTNKCHLILKIPCIFYVPLALGSRLLRVRRLSLLCGRRRWEGKARCPHFHARLSIDKIISIEIY